MTACSVNDCTTQPKCRGLCNKHYIRAWRAGLAEPPCSDCFNGHACDAHRPPVCVCATPTPSPMTGQCGRCYRLYEPRNPELAARMPAVREAWRRFLIEEGVFTSVTGRGVSS